VDTQELARMTAWVSRDGSADLVALEEPLEIRFNGAALAVTMRTPGHDEELAAGFLIGEGLLDARAPLRAHPPADLAANIVEVEGTPLRDATARRFYTTSSCGVCGRGALDEVAIAAPVNEEPLRVPRARLAGLPDALPQPAFAATGGTHAAGLFDGAGALVCAREDVGRHNALDKVVGRAALRGELPLRGRVLCVSGRLSFELVQKTAVAGAAVLVGVGAPSSLAVALAQAQGITLCGFARHGDCRVYSHAERVLDAPLSR
jgi:FdhD protein